LKATTEFAARLVFPVVAGVSACSHAAVNAADGCRYKVVGAGVWDDTSRRIGSMWDSKKP
jgi:hypothetical protein